MYAQDSSVAKKYIRHCIIDNIKYARYLFKVKQQIDIIFYRIKANSRCWCLPKGFRVSPT